MEIIFIQNISDWKQKFEAHPIEIIKLGNSFSLNSSTKKIVEGWRFLFTLPKNLRSKYIRKICKFDLFNWKRFTFKYNNSN